jgi:RNA polymerase sigma-70 factor (ECF subfamily)
MLAVELSRRDPVLLPNPTVDSIQKAAQQLLVLKCQIGDKDAFQMLHSVYGSPLRYYLRRLLGRADTHDIEQEVWLAVLRRVGGLRSPEAFLVWLYQIARNKALSQVSAEYRSNTLDPETVEDLPDDSHDPEFSSQDAAEIHQALDRLSPEHREVLVLRFLEDLSYEQMAEVVGCGVGTVRSRLHYARLTLRQHLEKHP